MKTGYLVSDVMTEKPVTLSSKDSLVDCAKEMAEQHVGAILVKDNGEVRGIITEQDMVRKGIARGLNPLTMKLKDIMEKDIASIEPDKDIFEALTKMKKLNIRHLPVVSGNRFVGLLTLKDILRIEPQLFELLLDRFELREAERKPIPDLEGRSGICNICGAYTPKTISKEGVLMCEVCAKVH